MLKGKNVSYATPACDKSFRADLRHIVWWEGYLRWGLGWIGKSPVLCSLSLTPFELRSVRIGARAHWVHLREAVSKSSKKPGEDQSGVMLMVIERSWRVAAVVTRWKTPLRSERGMQIKPELRVSSFPMNRWYMWFTVRFETEGHSERRSVFRTVMKNHIHYDCFHSLQFAHCL